MATDAVLISAWENYVYAFACIGLFSASWMALKLLNSIWSGVRTYICNCFKPDLSKFGSWAVITGGTDGIGKGYAQQLASRGLKVMLISRSAEKLSAVAAEIERSHGVETKTLAVDFTHDFAVICNRVRTELQDLDIGVLVNNVGMGYDYPQYFYELPTDQKIFDLINVNITSMTMMTRVVLPGMLKRRKGVIINVSSSSCVKPTPLLTQYSASKAYVDVFSRALQQEVKSSGVIIQSVVPFFVATKMSGIRKSSLLVPGPNEYANSALSTVGVQQRTFGCMSHALQGYVVGAVPECLFNMVTMNMMKSTRARALRKLQKKQ